jgi:hypothetical protein
MTRGLVTRSSDGKTIDIDKADAEQMEVNHNAKKTIGVTDFLIQKLAYNANGLVEYQGYAKPGTTTSTSGWLIKKLIYDGFNVTDILFEGGNLEFDAIWDNRASLDYS